MKVYVISKNGKVESSCYTSIEQTSKHIDIARQTLSKHMREKGFYSRNLMSVTLCEVVKIKGRRAF